MYMDHGITPVLGPVSLRSRSHHTDLPIKLGILRQISPNLHKGLKNVSRSTQPHDFLRIHNT